MAGVFHVLYFLQPLPPFSIQDEIVETNPRRKLQYFSDVTVVEVPFCRFSGTLANGINPLSECGRIHAYRE